MEDLSQIWREYRAAAHVKPGGIVIDIGSSEGYFSHWARSRGATVIPFDVRYGSAVGPHDGYCGIKGDGLHAYIVPDAGDTRMISLKTVLSQYDQVDFLKCDIEGGEYLIFNCDLSTVNAFAIEFHAWTTPDKPQEGLMVRDEPMPRGALKRLLTRLRRTHIVEIVGYPAAGGYLHGRLK